MLLDAAALLTVTGWALGALFTLIMGSYAYTFMISQRLYKLLADLKENHLLHMNEDTRMLKEQIERLERRLGFRE